MHNEIADFRLSFAFLAIALFGETFKSGGEVLEAVGMFTIVTFIAVAIVQAWFDGNDRIKPYVFVIALIVLFTCLYGVTRPYHQYLFLSQLLKWQVFAAVLTIVAAVIAERQERRYIAYPIAFVTVVLTLLLIRWLLHLLGK